MSIYEVWEIGKDANRDTTFEKRIFPQMRGQVKHNDEFNYYRALFFMLKQVDIFDGIKIDYAVVRRGYYTGHEALAFLNIDGSLLNLYIRNGEDGGLNHITHIRRYRRMIWEKLINLRGESE
jgi:hypothetical protein